MFKTSSSMAKNPSLSSADCNYHAGLVNQDGLNNPKTANQESYNTFDRSRINYQTQQFQTLQPCTVMAEISGNHARIKTRQDLRTYTLKSPLLSPTRLTRSFFQVPFSALMPNTWEYIVRQPVKGEDIVYSDVAPLLNIQKLKDFLITASNGYARVTYDSGTANQYLREFMLAFQLCDSMFGSGGLVATMGYRFPGSVTRDKLLSAWVDAFYEAVATLSGYDGTVGSGAGSFSFIDADGNQLLFNTETFSKVDLLSWMRDAYLYFFDTGEDNFKLLGFTPSAEDFFNSVKSATVALLSGLSNSIVVPEEHKTLDCKPFIAYQCIAAQFYSNSHVDDIYTSKMWQENALSYVYDSVGNFYVFAPTDYFFTVNGVSVLYDAYSGVFFSAALAGSLVDTFDSGGFTEVGVSLCYLWNLFQMKSSMRYGDYFTSGRVQPLAVGDVNAAVGGETGSLYVSAVDVNQSLWMQRFLNAVNRTRQNIQDYLQSLTGVRPQRVPPQPNFICTESFNVGNFEVENTAEDQGNVVTLLRNSESRFMYDAYFDEPSIIVGVDSFAVQMAYPFASLKIYDENDRLDWFNNFMQHVGDQSITMHELFAGSQASAFQPDDIFAYQLRYAQFKFGISMASGGFTDGSLPSWAVLFDDFGFGNKPQVYFGHISSYFLRNHNCDFNQLYASLTGNSNSSFFHFIKSLYFGDYVNSKQQAYPSLL